MPSIVPIGPFHPALKESAYYRLEVEGERIVGVDFKPGYFHKGIELLATKKSFHQNIFLCERVCGICSDAHSTCYCQAVEDLIKLKIPERARYLRSIAAELERMHSHLLLIAVIMHAIGFDTAFMHVLKDRELVMHSIETLCGKRVNYGFNTIGGVRRDISPKIKEAIKNDLEKLKRSVSKIETIVNENPLIGARTKNVGVLSKEEAKNYCVVGPTARASGISMDIRKDDPYAAYDELDWEIVVKDGCDVYSRVEVRVEELHQSIRIIDQALEELPDGAIFSKELSGFLQGEAYSRVEAPRGELFYYIKSDGSNIPKRVKIRTPSVMNNPSVVSMLVGDALADAPVIALSVDPCFACSDRVTIVDRKTGKAFDTTFEKLLKGDK
ncbi:MAG: nickel-dependent hydrogenase large subunit [Candidatus Bathyarchaeia archaeon]|nr:nickel-dependent hydrogenase large subunit [Candidatus Bathyarchaeota archaeon]